ncbi:hypothetical protein TrST_g3664 [Triparma strigata]|uniref:Leucine-rich repeat protein n=1 Tax=Triparma strigata TaxID=1606541 RepID=A0A9W7BHZ2_9STRA|nr:hypothetical protein TrST_g3664 [Triparma strigata]
MSRFGKHQRNPNFGRHGVKENNTLVLQHKIETARQTGQMNLSALGLTEIPEEALDLRAAILVDPGAGEVKAWECWGEETLTLLDLSDNPLSIIPDEQLERYQNLKKLRLRRCSLSHFSLAPLTSMFYLSLLDLSDNSIPGPFPLESLPQTLTSLNLNNNKVTDLGYPRLPQLQTLTASNNMLNGQTPDLSSCQNLSTIDLSKNSVENLNRLPDCLSNLNMSSNRLGGTLDLLGGGNLSNVDFSQNSLVGVEGIGGRVQVLDVSGNRIESLESLFGVDYRPFSEVKLKEFRARGNKLKLVPAKTFGGAIELTLLDLSDNDLSDLPSVLGYLPQLTRIGLEGNCLRGNIRPSMVTDIRALKRSLRFRAEPPVNNPKYLQQAGGEEEVKEEKKRVAVSSARSAVGGNGVLDVSKQSLTQLPTTTLEELQHEAYNEDEDRYYTLGSKVKTLKASQNRLTSIEPHWFDALRGLTTLDLNHNQLTTLPTNLATLRINSLILSSNPFDEVSVATFLSPHGSLSTHLVDSLTHINLSNCRLAGLPQPLFDLPCLQELNLSYNRLTDLSNPRSGWVVSGGLQELSVLDLSNNKISNLGDLPHDMKFKKNIRTLMLGNNELRQLPLELGYLITLTCLDLRGNPQRAIRPAILDKPVDALLEYFRSRMGNTASPASCKTSTKQTQRKIIASPDPTHALKDLSLDYQGSPKHLLDLAGEYEDDAEAKPSSCSDSLEQLHNEYDNTPPQRQQPRPKTNSLQNLYDEYDESPQHGTGRKQIPLQSACDEIEELIQDLERKLRHHHTTEMQKYAYKKQIAMEKAKLIKERRREKAGQQQA